MIQTPSEILERTSDAFVALDALWHCTYVNQRAGELFGRLPEALVGKLFWEEFCEHDAQPLAQALRRAVCDQEPVRVEAFHTSWGRWLESRIYPCTDGVAVFLTDVTERKQAEEALRQSEARFRALTEHSSDLVTVLEPDGTVRYHNPAATRVLGYSDAEMAGVNGFSLVHPDDLSELRERFERLVAEPDSTVSARFRLRRRDGSWVSLEGEGRNLLHDPAVGGLVINSRDVTLRHQAEERLRESEERHRLVIRATNDVVWDYDLVQERVFWGESLASAFGYDPEVEKPEIGWWEARIHPEDRTRVLVGLEEAISGGGSVWSDEYRFRRGDGRYSVVYDRGLLRRDEHGRPVRMVGSMQNLTEKRAAEAELRALFAAMQDVIFVIDREGRYRKIAPTSTDLLLRPSDELLGRTFHEFLPAEQAASFLRSVHQALEEDRAVGIEYSLEIAGKEVWFAATLSPMSDQTVIWVARDISERRRSEMSLRDSERRYREIFEQSRDTIYLRRIDGTLIDVNPAGEEVFGAPREELLRHNVREFYADPSQLEKLQREVAAHGLLRNYEIRLRRLDGTEFDAVVSTTEIRSETGEVAGYQGTVQDITERKEAEQALQRSEAWFRSLTQNALDIITVLDEQGRIRYATPSGAQVLGFQHGEKYRQPLVDMIHPEDRAKVATALTRLVRDGARQITLTARIRAGDGSWQVHQAIAQSLLHDPAVRGIVVNSRDVTEQRRLEAQLRQAQKMEAVGRLAGGVAHDFNNILMAITGFAALLESEIQPDEEAAQYLIEIHKAAERAASLTRQLLAFGRKQALRPKVVNLNAVVNDSGGMLRRLIREDVELVFRMDPDLGQCRVDPHQVEQVLMNLVVNATDALPRGGTIEVATGNRVVTDRDRMQHHYLQTGSYTTLSVRDTGLGMDADTMAQIFEPFFTTKEVGRGTGLGLATVYGIVKQSGGYIIVDSCPGEGSTFTVLFPRIARTQDAADPSESRELREGSGTILLAEDEDSVRLLARLALQKAGYVVLEARNGEEALRIAEGSSDTIDLLLTDVIMPQLGGHALARRLREQRPSLRVMYMSGYEGNAGREEDDPTPDAVFLAKPITPEALTRRVEEAIKG